jgi:hypothetical protein
MNSVFIFTVENLVWVVIGFGVSCIIGYQYTLCFFRQRGCKHNKGVNETSACDAICKSCGKNLGFIGSIK